MKIVINDKKLKAALENPSLLVKRYGKDMAKKIERRLAVLSAADSLADLWPPSTGPERLHELTADRAGQFSVDLVHPYRLLFEATQPLSKKDYPDEKERWRLIREITVLGIEDTHG